MLYLFSPYVRTDKKGPRFTGPGRRTADHVDATENDRDGLCLHNGWVSPLLATFRSSLGACVNQPLGAGLRAFCALVCCEARVFQCECT